MSPTYSGGPFNVLINESAMKEFGLTLQDVVNKRVFLHNTEVTVIGVLADFKWAGTVGPIVPTVYYNDAVANAVISVRVRSADAASTLAMIDRHLAPLRSDHRYSAAFHERRFRQAVPQ